MTNQEIMKEKRFRLAVHKGEYSRAISLFLRIKFPNTEDISKLPTSDIQTAQICVDNAFLQKWQREDQLSKEMR